MPLDDTTYQPQSRIVAILVEGRRRVDTGWFHGYPGNQISLQHRYCTVTAVSRQNDPNAPYDVNTQYALRYLARAIFGWENLNGIEHWNDDLKRTLKEVLEVYDAAIALAVMDELAHAT